MSKIGKYIVFSSKQPIHHLSQMLNCKDSTDDYKEIEFTGVITSEVFENVYSVSTSRPLFGLRCIISGNRIKRFLAPSELTDEEIRISSYYKEKVERVL